MIRITGGEYMQMTRQLANSQNGLQVTTTNR